MASARYALAQSNKRALAQLKKKEHSANSKRVFPSLLSARYALAYQSMCQGLARMLLVMLTRLLETGGMRCGQWDSSKASAFVLVKQVLWD